MLKTMFHNRPAVQIQNEMLRVTVLVNGGHVAEILDRGSGVNPLWIPPWTDEAGVDFGNNSETRLLRGIMGHNLCLDLFGPPSEAEAKAGISAHGEGSVAPYGFADADGGGMMCRCLLMASQLSFARGIRLEGRRILFTESVENLSAWDRPIGWTQHVTLGPPFLERGVTEFGGPFEPRLREVYTQAESSGGYTSHRVTEERGWFTARSPRLGVGIRYEWARADFPWMGAWEENCGRMHSPWNGRTMTQGMEFGVSPYPETRRAMIGRGEFRWISGRETLRASYWAEIGESVG